MEVGIKQAKNGLSKLVAEAKKGERVFLLSRGKRVAEIVPVAETEVNNLRGRGMLKDQIQLPPGWGSDEQRRRATEKLLKTIDGIGG